MAINTSKVVVGGLVAGLLLNVYGFLVFGMLLKSRMEAEMAAAAPSLQGKGMGGGAIASQVVTQFVVGILIVWLYAAIRPRYGPGMATASKAALVVWLCGFLFYQDWLHLGMMSMASYAIISVLQLIALLAAGWVGGRLYSEDGAPGMA